MSRRTLLLVRWGIFLAACAFLFLRLSADQSTHALWGEWRNAVDVAAWPVWGVMFAMAVLNWGIEAAKWRWLVAHLERMSLGRAFAATLAGTTVGLITPNRTGEFLGRVLFLAPEHRWQGGFATVLGSIAQFVVTLLLGGLALTFNSYLRFSSVEPSHAWNVVVWSALLIGCAAVFLFFSPGAFARLLFVDQTRREIGVDCHLLARHRVQCESCRNFSDTCRASGNNDEVHDHQDREHDHLDEQGCVNAHGSTLSAVSYTHLTLPTSDLVKNSVGGVT